MEPGAVSRAPTSWTPCSRPRGNGVSRANTRLTPVAMSGLVRRSQSPAISARTNSPGPARFWTGTPRDCLWLVTALPCADGLAREFPEDLAALRPHAFRFRVREHTRSSHPRMPAYAGSAGHCERRMTSHRLAVAGAQAAGNDRNLGHPGDNALPVTSILTSFRRTRPRSMWSSNRLGVAIGTSTPRSSCRSCSPRATPPISSALVNEQFLPQRSKLSATWAASSLAGHRTSERGMRALACPKDKDIDQWQGEGRGLAGSRLGTAKNIAALRDERDRLLADRR